MMNLIVFDSSVANGSVLVDCKSIVDQIVPQSGDAYIVPKMTSKLAAVYGVGVNLTTIQMQAASLRRTFQLDVQPVNVLTPAAQTKPLLMDMFDDPLDLEVTDLLQAQVIQSNAGAQIERVGAWLTDGPVKPVTGKIITLKFTGSTTVTAEAWSQCQLTASQSLIPGQYDIVGMRAIGATVYFARLLIPGQVNRPGVIGLQVATANDMERSRYGGFGVMGTFDNSIGVSAEFLCSAADTSQTVFLDLIYKGPSK